MTKYEWGVWSNLANTIHREQMTEYDARNWVVSWVNDCGEAWPDAVNMFSVCKRPVGEWEVEQ